MAEPADSPVTLALRAVARGEPRAAEELLPLVYDELRRLARSRIARLAPGQTLQPTALVHEAYLRLVRAEDPGWDGRRHFFGAAAQAMHEILTEQARRKGSLKRGGGRKKVAVSEFETPIEAPAEDMLALAEALQSLKSADAGMHEIVMLRFFAGLTIEEAAETLNMAPRTLERRWRFARAWLHKALSEDSDDGPTAR